jgi:transposase-like protein
MSSVLSDKHFHDEEAAYRFVEARVWAHGITCPHCGNADEAKIGKLTGKSTRIGVHKCYACRKPFTVKVGTIFESSHVALHLWLQAIFLIASSKKGVSANQLHRTLGVTLKTAWFMGHRIREAMREGGLGPLGGEGSIVEADETYFGKPEHVHESAQRKGRPIPAVASRAAHTISAQSLALLNVAGPSAPSMLLRLLSSTWRNWCAPTSIAKAC